ncbi:MAG: hypothetical protein ACI835_003865 [Planctomycetota bacterium]|jgi:hypothetical protein
MSQDPAYDGRVCNHRDQLSSASASMTVQHVLCFAGFLRQVSSFTTYGCPSSTTAHTATPCHIRSSSPPRPVWNNWSQVGQLRVRTPPNRNRLAALADSRQSDILTGGDPMGS